MKMRLIQTGANCRLIWFLFWLATGAAAVAAAAAASPSAAGSSSSHPSSAGSIQTFPLKAEEMDYLALPILSSSPTPSSDYNSQNDAPDKHNDDEADEDDDDDDDDDEDNEVDEADEENLLMLDNQVDQLVEEEEVSLNLSDTDPLVQLQELNDSVTTSSMETYEDDELLDDGDNGQLGGRNNSSRRKRRRFRPHYPRLRDSLVVVIPVTFIFAIILLIGLVGNVSTCVVIAKNNYMHTATNYYLFSLAVSDLLLLISGLPQEMYLTWLKWPYVFGEAFCLIRGLAAETSANATVLTITAFTFERYVAICHPLRSHKLSQLSRVIRLVLLIWILALTLALPQAAQFGVVDEVQRDQVVIEGAWCTIKRTIIPYAFQISIIVFFLIPMTIITALYVLIGLKLRRTRGPNRTNHELTVEPRNTHNRHSQSHVIRMLVAICLCFFICWSPFHIQRLMAIYSEYLGIASSQSLRTLYKVIEYTSGILYYVSTCINPILYHIMSHKFRQAFKDTMSQIFGRPSSRVQHRTYSSISHHHRASRMGVHHHQHNLVHGNNHHYGSRRGATAGGGDMETCINCRHTPSMCSCRGKSKGPVYKTPSTAKSQQPTGLMAFLSGRRGRRQPLPDSNVVSQQEQLMSGSGASTLPSSMTHDLSPTLTRSIKTDKVGRIGKGSLVNSPLSSGKTTRMIFILTKKKQQQQQQQQRPENKKMTTTQSSCWDPSESTVSTEVQMDSSGRSGPGGGGGVTVTSQGSVDSANSNTISNSSLLDVQEFTESECRTGEELAEILKQMKDNMMPSPTRI